MLPQVLISISAVLTLIAGALHFHGTFFGPDLRPRDPSLEARMKEVSPGETNRITMWDAWIAFNATQSLGLMLFGALYGYLSIFQLQVLLQTRFLILVGAVFLVGFFVLAMRYLHNIPTVAFGSCLVLYVVGAAVAVA